MKKLGHQGDRLSELPPSLIHHILSFLPLKDVVSTTILSKRWENLWTTAPCLNLKIDCEIENEYSGSGTEDEEDVDEVKSVERLLKFVNRALIVWKGVKILKFKIDIKYDYMMSLDSDVTVWTRFAVNKEVEELEIITAGEHIAPKCLNSCSSLTKLSLECCNVEMLNSPSWNQLKSLRLDVFSGSPISGDLIDQILLGSPELEVFELHLEYNNEDLNIRSTSLKKLKIENRLHLQRDIQPKATLRICCPHLDTLEISGLFGKCLFSDVSSLIDITLHIRNFPLLACSVGETLKQIFSTIQHAENVSLSDLCVEVFGASHKKYLHSPLPNVKFLKLDLRHIQSGEMMNLFGIFPNLKMLVIKHEVLVLRKSPDSDVVTNMEFESNFLLELKTVEISSNFYDLSIFWFIEFLLKHAVKLEMMVLRSTAFASNRQKVFEISEKLLNMQRSSPTAKVVLKNK